MPRRVAPTIVLLTAPGTLREIDAPLQKAGVRVVRLEAVRPRPVDPRRWLPRVLRVTSPDTVVVTSRAGVDMGIRPWRSERVPPSGLEFWAVGPGTALALRTAGIRGIHRPAAAGASNIAKALRKTKRRKDPGTSVRARRDLASLTACGPMDTASRTRLSIVSWLLGPLPRRSGRRSLGPIFWSSPAHRPSRCCGAGSIVPPFRVFRSARV